MSVDAQLRQVFADVFEADPTTLGDDDSPETIEAWDSVGHLSLILALEAEFSVQFDAEEIPELVRVGIIRARIEALTGDGV